MMKQGYTDNCVTTNTELQASCSVTLLTVHVPCSDRQALFLVPSLQPHRHGDGQPGQECLLGHREAARSVLDAAGQRRARSVQERAFFFLC